MALSYIKHLMETTRTSTSATYGNITGGTIDAGDLTASTKYLAILRARIDQTTSNAVAGIQLYSADDTDLATHTEFLYGYAIGSERGVMTTAVFTTAATPTDIDIQIKVSGGTISVFDASVVLIDLDDLGASNYVHTSGEPDTEPTTSWASFATLAAADLGTATEWLILGSAGMDDAGLPWLYGLRLYAADGVDTQTVQSEFFQEGEQTGGRETQTLVGIHNTATADEDVDLFRRQTLNNQNAVVRNYNLIALKLSAFGTGSVLARNDDGTAFGTTEATVESITAPEAADLLVLSSSNHGVATSGRMFIGAHVEDDGTPLDSGDVGFYQNARNDSGSGERGMARTLDFMADTAGTEDLDLQLTGDVTNPADHVFLGALVMEEAPPPNDARLTRLASIAAISYDGDVRLTRLSTLTAIVSDDYASGTEYDEEPTDALGLTDSVAAAKTIAVAITEALGLADVVQHGEDNAEVATEALGLTDTVAAAVDAARAITDPVGLTDSVQVAKTIYVTITDSVGLADSVVRAEDNAETATDALGLTDSVQVAVTRTATPTDALGLVDSVEAAKATPVTPTDALGLVDAVVVAKEAAQAATDALGLTDSVEVELVHVQTPVEALGLTDTVTAVRIINVVITEPLGLTDPVVRTRTATVTITEPLGLTDGTALKVETSQYWKATPVQAAPAPVDVDADPVAYDPHIETDPPPTW